ncbi:rRNA methyltransferase 3, mitochondrial-like [Anopheles albimanus]|uniref:tRNA/rRNA methyltransferase SpoU type domain-containing protein n=1 Tax=Anopheles albimanus TaxID=7167 RepID=A0A182FR51_ANOAL|nr:rRNA methyltransferase 3, mitochondrial-like [Anopheles albimanus]
MFRTLRMVCSGRKNIDLALYRQFSGACETRQKFSPVLCTPRGSRPAVEPAPAPAVPNPVVTDQHHGQEEFDAADELFHNRNGIANLKVSELLKDVPRTKTVRKPRTQGNGERDQRKPAAPVLKKTEIEKDTLKVLQHRYQDRCESEDRYDKALKLRYTVLQSNDPRYGDLKLLVSSRKRREREQMLVLEGRRLILDGCAAGLRLEAVVASDVRLLGELGLKSNPKDCPFFLVNRQTMMEWSSLTTSPGLIGVFAAPQNLAEVIARNSTAGSKRLPVTVVCDNIREPNNLGSVIRSCAAVSAQEVILLKGCAHPWDLKCLRGGAGSHFRIPIHGPMELYQLPELTRAGSIFVIADNKRPDDGQAGGFRWEQYDRIDYGSADHVVLFIGGETYGVSEDVRGFVNQLTKTSETEETGRERKIVAHIPLANGVESLNTASALSVLLYEIRKSLQPLMEET